MKTGRLTLLTNAMAREVTTDTKGCATGVAYIDKRTRRDEHVQAKVVVLAASALRIGAPPAQLAIDGASRTDSPTRAASWAVHHRHHGHGCRGASFRSSRTSPAQRDGVGGMHVYMPWWIDNKKLDFPRGYHIEPWGGRGMPSIRLPGRDPTAIRVGGYGKELKADYRHTTAPSIGFDGRGEMIPNDESYCELDPDVVDR